MVVLDKPRSRHSLDKPSNPTHLLSMAVKKRRSLMSQKDRDLRIELLTGGMIQHLCKHIGEQRAARKRRRFSDFVSTATKDSMDDSGSIPNVSDIPLPPGPCPKELRLSDESSENVTDSVSSGSCKSQTSNDPSPKLTDSFSATELQISKEMNEKHLPPKKRVKTAILDYDSSDPFGLDAFFQQIKSISVK